MNSLLQKLIAAVTLLSLVVCNFAAVTHHHHDHQHKDGSGHPCCSTVGHESQHASHSCCGHDHAHDHTAILQKDVRNKDVRTGDRVSIAGTDQSPHAAHDCLLCRFLAEHAAAIEYDFVASSSSPVYLLVPKLIATDSQQVFFAFDQRGPPAIS